MACRSSVSPEQGVANIENIENNVENNEVVGEEKLDYKLSTVRTLVFTSIVAFSVAAANIFAPEIFPLRDTLLLFFFITRDVFPYLLILKHNAMKKLAIAKIKAIRSD